MRLAQIIAGAVLIGASLSSFPAAVPDPLLDDCAPFCTIRNPDGTHVTTTISTTFVDDPVVNTDDPTTEDPPPDDFVTIDTTPPDPFDVYVNDPRCLDNMSPQFCVVPPSDPTTPTTPPPTTVTITYPTVHASDLRAFRPTPPTLTTEPDGAGLIGKPVNFIATATPHTQQGTVLGYPVSVHFQPTAYTFDYGDTTTRTTPTGGTTWASTGTAQFTETPTSHTYPNRGTYTTSSTVTYTAHVNFGDGQWRPVIGTITAPGPTTQIRIYEPKTALVNNTCTTTPTSTGC